MTSLHKCPMPGCSIKIPQTKLACRDHWYELPAELRREVSASNRDRRPGSFDRHLTAVRAAYRWYAQQTDTP